MLSPTDEPRAYAHNLDVEPGVFDAASEGRKLALLAAELGDTFEPGDVVLLRRRPLPDEQAAYAEDPRGVPCLLVALSLVERRAQGMHEGWAILYFELLARYVDETWIPGWGRAE